MGILKNTCKLLTIFIISLSNYNGFTQDINKFLTDTISVSADNVPIHKQQHYFPKEMFPQRMMEFFDMDDGGSSINTTEVEQKYDNQIIEWYSVYLFAMKEPLLFNKKTDKHSYRFTWLRMYDKPMAIRIEKNGGEYHVYWKMLDGAGGYKPEALIVEDSKSITEQDWLDFTAFVEKADFLNMELGRDAMANDKSEWVLEGNDTTNYRVVRMGAPTEGDFYNACNFLISLTAVPIEEEKKY
ncbi:hypothetical protein [Aquimarina pacifica]|uniref:hypothetical protein n=1 Tax=Aquimarina pacifica TaxID=1296415 RepID=UPI00046E54C3|nr:hypothetical protein [Aquimarina pacifica]